MPQNPKKFAEEPMPEWSRWKHEILEEYLGAFAGILQKYRTVYLVDGFAGAGRHGDGSEGSAVRSAKLARSIEYDLSRNYHLHCINVEYNQNVFKLLEQNTQNYAQFVSNYYGGFDENIGSILGEIADQPTLFFLDPFGVKELEWITLKLIFGRKPLIGKSIITEFLVRFDVQTISRLNGCVGNIDERSRRNVDVLLKIYGLSSVEEWKQIVNQTGTSLSGLTTTYEKRLAEYFKYVVRLPIRTTDGNQFKYYLIFATQNEKAISVMNNVLYWVKDMRSREIYETTEGTGQLSLFDTEENQILNELNTLKKLVLNHLDVGSRIVRANLVTRIATLDDYFGAFSDAHFTAVLGGRPTKIKVPKNFESLKEFIDRNGAPSNDKTIITRIK